MHATESSVWQRNGFTPGLLVATIALMLTLFRLTAILEARLTALETKVEPIWQAYWKGGVR